MSVRFRFGEHVGEQRQQPVADASARSRARGAGSPMKREPKTTSASPVEDGLRAAAGTRRGRTPGRRPGSRSRRRCRARTPRAARRPCPGSWLATSTSISPSAAAAPPAPRGSRRSRRRPRRPPPAGGGGRAAARSRCAPAAARCRPAPPPTAPAGAIAPPRSGRFPRDRHQGVPHRRLDSGSPGSCTRAPPSGRTRARRRG